MPSCVVTHWGILSSSCLQRSGLECGLGFTRAPCRRKLHQLHLDALNTWILSWLRGHMRASWTLKVDLTAGCCRVVVTGNDFDSPRSLTRHGTSNQHWLMSRLGQDTLKATTVSYTNRVKVHVLVCFWRNFCINSGFIHRPSNWFYLLTVLSSIKMVYFCSMICTDGVIWLLRVIRNML